VEKAESLKPIVFTSDLVISYVPALFHVGIAKVCLELGKNLVTASYISNEMQALDSEVKKKGLIFLNELGLDPGIDHLATMKVIEEVKEKGGKIV
jgi:saccharopine dehydrogenase (NAD+, L-glutamate forming)